MALARAGRRELDRRASLLVLVVVLLLGAALRFQAIGDRPLWQDEAVTAAFARQPTARIWGKMARLDETPPLYSTIMHLWTGVAGEGEAALRLPSAIFGLLVIPVCFLIGRALGGQPLGLVAALLAATSPTLISYAQEARGYSALILASSVAVLATLRIIRPAAGGTRAEGWWLLYGISAALSLYLHTTAILVPFLLSIAVLAAAWRHPERRRALLVPWTVTHAALLALWAWWGWLTIGHVRTLLVHYWIPPPTPVGVARELYLAYGLHFLPAPLAVAAASTLALWALAVLGFFRMHTGRVLIAAVILGAPLAVLLLSFYRPIFIARVLLWPLPILYVLVASGILGLGGRRVAVALTAIVVGLHLCAWSGYATTFEKEPWPRIVERVATRGAPGDVVLLAPSEAYVPFSRYFIATGFHVVPVAPAPGVDDATVRAVQGPAAVPIADLDRVLADAQDVWLIARGATDLQRRLLERLQKRFCERDGDRLDWHEIAVRHFAVRCGRDAGGAAR